jgi:NaMN:DMB phosphoribosyltransferase
LGCVAGLGGGAPGVWAGGGGSLGTAKWLRKVSEVPSAVVRVRSIDELPRSSE